MGAQALPDGPDIAAALLTSAPVSSLCSSERSAFFHDSGGPG